MGLRLWSRIAGDSDSSTEKAPKSYMEPSYLIWTCCEMIAPVVGSLFGLMNT